MIIIHTHINNIEDKIKNTDLNASKILLMNEIINHFLPIFREEIENKKEILNKHEQDISKLKTEISKSKKELLKQFNNLKKEKLIKEMLQEITILFSNDILYGNNKKIVLDILNDYDSLDHATLKNKIKLLKNMVYKNVNKILVRN